MPDATPGPAPLPPLPYAVETLTYGRDPGHPMPTKRFPDGTYGGILTADEVAVWAHVEALTARLAEADDRVGAPPADEKPAKKRR